MDYSSLRAEARKRLSGKWGKVILCMIVTGLVVGLINSIPGFTKATERVNYGYGIYITVTKDTIVSVLLTLAAEVVSFVFSAGLIAAFWKVWNGEDIGAADGVKIAVANWKKPLMILGNVVKKILIPVIMVVAAMILNVLISNGVVTVICSILSLVGYIWGFVVGLYYSLVYIIAADEPNMSEEEVVNKSKELMADKRGKIVVLSLTFFGWILLGCLSLGIGMLWVTPYMQFATFAFYEACKGGSTSAPKAEPAPEEPRDQGPIQEG